MKPATLKHPREAPTEFHGMVTVAPQMLALFEQVRRVAATEATVLIRGETGTGKELVARGLHALSSRRNGPFQALNCATLTPELLASELFGHKKGAFTGAIGERRGLFALAHGGTLFLDEIAEVPLDIQARLLRVLQERTFVPLGGSDPVQVDVRLLSATNKALRGEVAAGRFREDLLYRVRVVPLFLPRLAEREGDVAALTWHFVDRFNEQGRRRVSEVEAAAMEALQAYPWPGNVRELRNVLEYVYALGSGPVLRLEDLPPEIRLGPEADREQAGLEGGPGAERERILAALQATGGRKGEAAASLGMSRSTLWRKLREYRLAQ